MEINDNFKTLIYVDELDKKRIKSTKLVDIDKEIFNLYHSYKSSSDKYVDMEVARYEYMLFNNYKNKDQMEVYKMAKCKIDKARKDYGSCTSYSLNLLCDMSNKINLLKKKYLERNEILSLACNRS